MSKSLRNIHGSKQRSSSQAVISLHFNKADEDQLEISYGDKTDSDDSSKKDQTSSKSALTSDDQLKHSQSVKERIESNLDACEKGDEFEEASAQKNRPNSRDSTPSRDSVVKDYWSRISKRAGSLDSDLGAPDKNLDQNDGWMFFKDIKGKLTKTLEERKQTKSFTKEKLESATSTSFYRETESDPDRTPTEDDKNQDKNLQLSPAIEVPFSDNVNTEFENYVEGELAKAKCEILGTKTVKPASNTHFYQNLNKPVAANKNVDTSLSKHTTPESSLNKTEIKSIEQAVIASDGELTKIKEIDKIRNESNFHKAVVSVKRYYYFVKSYWNRLVSQLLIAVLAFCLVPVPSWFSGFIAGAFLSGYIVYCLFKPGKPKEKFFIPDFTQLSPSSIPVVEVDEPIIYKGWMNELPFDMTYNPDTYHVNCTRSLYIRLDGSYLRVSYPQTNIPKRAMFNEPRFERLFIHQQHYDITGASVELLPIGLAKKRLWSKKYPICLTIPNTKQAVLSNAAKDSDSNSTQKTMGKKESPVKKSTPRINEYNEVVLYLFSRTDREKDLWYNRFKRASRIKLLKNYSPSSTPDISGYEMPSFENKRTMSADLGSLQMNSPNELVPPEDELDDFTDLSMTKQQKFDLYMSRLLAPLRSDPFSFTSGAKDKKNGDGKVSKSNSSALNSLPWLNILIGRVFFDFLTEDIWAQCVAEKIQKKLSKIKLPVFLKELSIKDLNLGTALPKIHRASEPTIDQRGLWIDIDLSYNGSFQMTLETKINLLRYRCDPEELSLSDSPRGNESINSELRSPVYNSEEEDSAESSSDDDIPQPEIHDSAAEERDSSSAGGSTGKKLLRLVDRFAQSTYFQHAAKNKYIKKAMEDISNTPLVLTVEVQWLTGTLALNIPPMPSDRLWYGFRTNPSLSIVARPKLGHHAVTLTHITEWIERKLVLEFQKLLVMPNMDDLIVPIMQPDSDLPKA